TSRADALARANRLARTAGSSFGGPINPLPRPTFMIVSGFDTDTGSKSTHDQAPTRPTHQGQPNSMIMMAFDTETATKPITTPPQRRPPRAPPLAPRDGRGEARRAKRPNSSGNVHDRERI